MASQGASLQNYNNELVKCEQFCLYAVLRLSFPRLHNMQMVLFQHLRLERVPRCV